MKVFAPDCGAIWNQFRAHIWQQHPLSGMGRDRLSRRVEGTGAHLPIQDCVLNSSSYLIALSSHTAFDSLCHFIVRKEVL